MFSDSEQLTVTVHWLQSTDDSDQLSEIVMLTIKKCYIARPDPIFLDF